MNGVLFVNKPEGLTSRDVVNQISRIYGTKKVGHTGTLDPMATGVLIVCLGSYTKLVNLLTSSYKEYIADMKFGVKTDTGDVTGNVLETKEVNVSYDELKRVIDTFPKEYIQTVPKYSAVKVNSRKGGGIKSIQSVIQEACREKTERDRRRGILNRPVRAMVAGIPNVGKSTFINALAGKACAKTGNKPGVTKGKQWIRLNKNVELLDTPGILWPKFEDQEVGLKLAFIGSIKDEVLQTEELAAELAGFLSREYPGVMEEKYAVEASEDKYECLRRIAESRHCLVRGSELDTEKAASILLDDFRNGRLGRITLETPEGSA